ncbi:hypothetical protein EJ05DRAFT_506546 [Pseudovirgaria hyperparasitica]|uniref:Transcription factor domain-containing protein n=1 Tax=Pseudovirgaria hyperparasitica TaxID=470096 RepID=A0A6A6WL20_9PEZI|nr:uncharacterized protein EJ05DRAFT_506546 [Pseudovirgaria hyperparasitica]KAF2762876.1 hypothetical protein EJ05DRAFT_506546 [Pseudovirgaria hyperparasitica]
MSKYGISPGLVLTDLYLEKFFQDITQFPQAEGIFGGSLANFRDLYKSMREGSPIRPALTALVIALAARDGKGAVNDNSSLGMTGVPTPGLAWHITAAASIVQGLQETEYSDPITQRLLCGLISQAMYHFVCFEAPLAFDIKILEHLYSALTVKPSLTPREILWRHTCTALMLQIRITTLQSHASFAYPATSEASAIVSSLISLSAALASRPSQLPLGHEYTTHTLSIASPDIYKPTVHQYTSFWVANDWAHFRTLRLFTMRQVMICTQLSAGWSSEFETLWTQLPNTRAQIQDVIDDICAATPFHIGYREMPPSPPVSSMNTIPDYLIVDTPGSTSSSAGISPPQMESSSLSRPPAIASTARNPNLPTLHFATSGAPNGRYARLISAGQIIWPLCFAGIMAHGWAQKTWIMERLECVGREFGYVLAGTLSEAVQATMDGVGSDVDEFGVSSSLEEDLGPLDTRMCTGIGIESLASWNWPDEGYSALGGDDLGF